MKKFECPKCNRNFSQKLHLDRHLNKKNSCDNIEVNIDNNKKINVANNKIIDAKTMRESLDQLKCVYCDKEFTRKNNVIYHIKNNCKKVKEIEDEKYQIFTRLKQLEEENNKLKEKLEKKDEDFEKKLIEKLDKKDEDFEKKLEKQKKTLEKTFQKTFEKTLKKEISSLRKESNITKYSNNTTNSNNNNNIDNSINTQQNIYLANYDPKNMPALTNDEIVAVLKRGFQTPVELTRKIHFNPKFPEFHNIFIPRINERYGMVFMNNDWRLMDKDDLVDDIYENKRAFVVENLDTFINQLNEFKKKSLKRWLDMDDDDESIKNTKDDIKKLLFDNRKLAMNQKKEIEKMNRKKKLEIIKRQVPKIEEVKSESDISSESSSNYSSTKD
jgi:hypothetical protein